ncbi:heparan sulfate glucosamine 3-O-sulfotransferase 1-like [Oratosquilla oratoria]|uniref:heparan sulfate glucosamine 3-O-sulfotransferase 1-like n=1 Tax=Oratosquilla oratoria TaxID=337810 RepID=UPI003F775A0E
MNGGGRNSWRKGVDEVGPAAEVPGYVWSRAFGAAGWCCLGYLSWPARRLFVLALMALAVYCTLHALAPAEPHHAPREEELQRAVMHSSTLSQETHHEPTIKETQPPPQPPFCPQVPYNDKRKRLPKALIIGVRKGGTRALLEMLDLHPYVRVGKVEMHFFDDNFNKGYRWYLQNMPYTFESQMTIEKTPSYFVTPDAVKRVYVMDKKVKLLLIVRDPTTRLVSDYLQIVDNNKRRGKELSFQEHMFTADGKFIEKRTPVRVGLYAVHLAMWLQHFPTNQIHVVDGDALIRRPFSELIKVQNFLGLPPCITPNHFYYNMTKGFYCMQTEKYHKCLANDKGRTHPHMDPALLTIIRQFYQPHNEKFYKMVGRNFSWPGK